MKPFSEILEHRNKVLITPIEMNRAVPRAFTWIHAESFRTERFAEQKNGSENVIDRGHDILRSGWILSIGSHFDSSSSIIVSRCLAG